GSPSHSVSRGASLCARRASIAVVAIALTPGVRAAFGISFALLNLEIAAAPILEIDEPGAETVWQWLRRFLKHPSHLRHSKVPRGQGIVDGVVQEPHSPHAAGV